MKYKDERWDIKMEYTKCYKILINHFDKQQSPKAKLSKSSHRNVKKKSFHLAEHLKSAATHYNKKTWTPWYRRVLIQMLIHTKYSFLSKLLSLSSQLLHLFRNICTICPLHFFWQRLQVIRWTYFFTSNFFFIVYNCFFTSNFLFTCNFFFTLNFGFYFQLIFSLPTFFFYLHLFFYLQLFIMSTDAADMYYVGLVLYVIE